MLPSAIEPVGVLAVVVAIVLLVFAVRFALKLVWRVAIVGVLIVAALYAAGVLV
ncbi:hypothetical protein [Haladaptatus salinisoli]|uniref:hypothetical protein n=1 Tax=Haladaptatus salinisoli TaxID=2884876 RepID=UPI001D0AB6B0|nr:hypothetical protein [Haladaptatus salinisoli]